MPGLCSGQQRKEPVPEVPAALRKGSLVRAPGSPQQQSPRHPPAPAVPAAALQTYESDVVLAPPAGRWGGCGVGAQPQGAPLLVQLPPARQRGGCQGVAPSAGPAGGCQGDLPEGTLLRQAEGQREQHVAALAGREAQQLLRQQAPLVWGHKGLSRTRLAGVQHARPEPWCSDDARFCLP